MKPRRVLLFAVLLFAASGAFAQDPQTGYPPYGSFAPGGFDGANLQNLNTNFSIRAVASPGRGMNFQSRIVYDSLLWTQVTANGTTSWTPVTDSSGNPTWGWKEDAPGGYIKSHSTTTGQTKCFVGGQWYFVPTINYSNFIYVDNLGTDHTFPVNYTISGCSGTITGTKTGYALDGSGYFLNGPSGVVTTSGGIAHSSGVVTDANGNEITKTVVNSSETDWKDTVGNTVLKVISESSSVQYEFLDPTGAYQTTTMNLGTFSIKTNFACSGVVEYTGTASLPTSIVLPNGQQYSLTYEPTPGHSGYYTGRVQRVTLPTGGYYEYDYPTTGNDGINCPDSTITSVNRVINDGTSSATWGFARSSISGSAGTTTATDPLGNQTLVTFDSNGHETTRKVYAGTSTSGTRLRTINTTWASNGTPATRVTILEDGTTQSETDTTFDSYGNLDQRVEYDWGQGGRGSLIRTTNITYLSSGGYTTANILNRPTEVTVKDSSGTVQARTDISYDQSGYINSPCVTGAAQHNDTSYGCSYTTRGDPTSVTTYTNASAPSGGVTKNFYYDSLGNLRQAAVNCCQQKQWNFSATTQYAFPDSEVDGPSGLQLTTSFTYDAYTGQAATTTDPNNQATSFSYDTLRRPTQVSLPDGSKITYSYNDSAHTVTTAAPVAGGGTAQQVVAYDELGRPSTTTLEDASSNVYSIVETQHDLLSRPYKVSNPYTGSPQYWTTTSYDALGRPTSVALPDGSATSYSYSGNTVTVTDPAGKKRESVLDAAGRLASVYEPDSSNNLTVQTSYTYAVTDALAGVSEGSQSRSYAYDGMGRLTSVTTPEAGTASYMYDSFNNVLSRTDARGVITNYSYDGLNRLTQISYNVGSTGVPATPTVSFTYGTNASQYNNGRLITMTDGLGSESYSYNNLGEITQVQKVVSGTTYTMGYGYQAGELTSITYPSGRAVNQNYDAIGRLAKVFDSANTYASNLGYNAASELTGLNYGNGVTATIGYSSDRLQLTSLAYTKGTSTLFSLGYGYGSAGSNNGQIMGVTDNVDSGRTITYSYDNLARLLSAVTNGDTNYPRWGLSFSYDRYGNRTQQTVTAGSAPSNSVTIDQTTNRISGSPYAYDANGNMTNDGLNSSIVYDAENRLVSINSGSATYSYDGKSLRGGCPVSRWR
jgi:YD repeat-containing protein